MNLDDFVKKYLGKKVEVAGSANALYQCVDLANLFIKEVLGLPIIEWTNAKDFPSKAGDNYDYIKNTPLGIPEKGDLMIWGSGAGGGYGHIAVFLDGGVNSFRSFDQNWSTGSPCHIQGHYYGNVIGWLRSRKEQDMGDQSPELKACLVMHTQLVDETVKLKQELEDVRGEFKAATDDFKREKERLTNEAEARNKEYKDFLADVAIAIGTTQNPAQVLAELKSLVKNDEEAQKAIDTLREEEVRWNKKRIELDGEILKLREQLKTKDLSKQDLEVLLRAIVRKLIDIARSR